MEALATQFGEATGLEDFVRKAQMLNYVGHRAMFEGLNAHLWKPGVGPPDVDEPSRLAEHGVAALQLRLRHPRRLLRREEGLRADPRAAEPPRPQGRGHEQHPRGRSTGARVSAELVRPRGPAPRPPEPSSSHAPANATTEAFTLARDGRRRAAALLRPLRWPSRDGRLLSDNFYWQARRDEDIKALNDLPKVALTGARPAHARRRRPARRGPAAEPVEGPSR